MCEVIHEPYNKIQYISEMEHVCWLMVLGPTYTVVNGHLTRIVPGLVGIFGSLGFVEVNFGQFVDFLGVIEFCMHFARIGIHTGVCIARTWL